MAGRFLTVAGVTMKVLRDQAGEDPTKLMGRRRRAVDGTTLSTERTPKRGFFCTAEFATASAYNDFLDAISVPGKRGVWKPVEVTSDATIGLTRGAVFQGWVTPGRAQPFQAGVDDAGRTMSWIVPFTIEED